MIHCVLVWFLKPVLLSENAGTLNQQLEACRSMPQHAAACRSMPQHAAASQNFLGDRWCLLSALNCLTRPHPCLLDPWTSGLSGINRVQYPPVPGDMQWVGLNPRDCPPFSLNNFCTNTGKRHGRSSGMRHGWRSSWSGVRTPVRLSVQGPVGEAPATAPFSIPLHHRYRRCVGWRVSSIFFLPPTPAPGPPAHTQKRGTRHGLPAAARPVTATAVRRVAHVLLIVLFRLPAEEDSNSGLQGSSRLHSRCTTLPKPRPGSGLSIPPASPALNVSLCVCGWVVAPSTR